MLPARRILYSLVSFAVTLLSFSSSHAQTPAIGTIELTASASYDRDTVLREEIDEEVTIGTGTAGSVTLTLPSGTLQGRYSGASEAYQLTPRAEGSVSYDDQILSINASASIQLSGDARYPHILPRGDHIPWVQANLKNFGLTDFITLYSSDPSHWGQQVLVDVSVDVTGALSASLENSAQDGSLANAVYSASGGPDSNVSGYVQRETPNGEYMSTSVGDFNLATPKTATRQNYPMWIASGLGLPPQVGGNLVGVGATVTTTARVAADSGGSASANATMTLRNPRIGNVRLASDSTLIADELLTSISRSGYDWLGNGEPVIELDEFSWDNAAGGMFGTDTNWDPVGVPGSQDLAKIELPGTYTVNVGSQEVKQLRIGGDPSFNVSFSNANLTVGATSLDPPGIDIDNGNFTLDGGTLTSVHSRIGSEAATTVEVNGSTSTWNNTGKFSLGDGGVEIKAMNGGELDLEEVIVGESETGSIAEARLIARGLGSSIEMGNVQVGLGGAGYIRAEEGGSVSGEEVRVGVGSGSIGRIASLGRAPSGGSPSKIELDKLLVGYSGLGYAFVDDGGEMEARGLTIGLFDVGFVFVSKPNSILKAPFNLSVGGSERLGEESQGDASGSGELSITDGAKVVAGEGFGGELTGISDGMTIGTISSGSVYVDGEIGETRPFLEVFGGLRVGNIGQSEAPNFKGSLEVANGGRVKADNITIAVNENSNGIITVTGENATRADISELEVSGDIEIGGYYFNQPASGLGKMVGEAGAMISVSGDINIGTSNPGELEIRGVRASNEDFSTIVSAFAIRAGRSRPGSIVIDDRSELRTSILALGIPHGTFEDEQPTGTLDVVNGGQLEVDSLFLNHGLAENASGSVIVKGTANLISATIGAGSIIVGPNSELQVLDQGQVVTENLTIEGGGEVFVEGDGGIGDRPAKILVSNDLVMGGSFGNESFLGIDEDSKVEVQGDITYTSGARMCIDGTLTSSEIFAAGFLELGCSLGTAIIDGDFTLGPTGVLEIEVWGPTPVDEHDTMIVTGDVDLQGTLHFVFKDYAPQQGETFAILDAAGSYSDAESSVIYSGLKEGFEARYESIDGTMSLVAESDAELLDASDPVTYNMTLLGGNGRANFTLFGETGFRYVFEFSTDLENWIALEEVEGANAVLYFDHGGSGLKRQFYRVRRTAL